MNGGSIAGNIIKKMSYSGKACGGGVYVEANTIFTINGGSIKDNTTNLKALILTGLTVEACMQEAPYI